LIKICRNFSDEQIDIQKSQLEKLGLFSDFDIFYKTTDKKYEAEQIRVFGRMIEKNLVYRGFRPIH
jgi:isoleucyl-tRNA synthetase